jgi:oxygen-independent coproporphyrinogen III oxidase
MDEMVSAIKVELTIRRDYLLNEEIQSVYFGGGTPSLLNKKQLQAILNTVHSIFKVKPGAEITLEANHDDSGINRLSIGIQSFNDDDLRFMNRAHNSEQALMSVKNAKEAGIENISIDLIYGIQNSPAGQWEENLETALNLEVDHLSCYALTIEPRTRLADMIRKEKVSAPDDEKTTADFAFLMDQAAKAGYEHYEISNFARNKKYAVHNTSYWQGKKFLGVGPSAHSYDIVSRQWNISNNAEYIRSLKMGKVSFEREVLSETNKFNEYVLVSLRTMWGIDLDVANQRYGQIRKEKLHDELMKFVNDGMLINKGSIFILTAKGKLFTDRISGMLFQ